MSKLRQLRPLRTKFKNLTNKNNSKNKPNQIKFSKIKETEFQKMKDYIKMKN